MKRSKRQRELVVDRAIWLRGSGGSFFEPENKGMCILGLYLREVVGITKNKLLDKGSPEDVLETYTRPKDFLNRLANAQACWLLDTPDNLGGLSQKELQEECSDSEAANELISLNDNEDLSDEDREEQIKEHFKQFNVKVRFIGSRVAHPDPEVAAKLKTEAAEAAEEKREKKRYETAQKNAQKRYQKELRTISR